MMLTATFNLKPFRQKTPWICLAVVLAGIAPFLLAALKVTTIPVFADGTHHVRIAQYVQQTGGLPSTDITGAQPSNLNIPQSIPRPQPFLDSPLFYVLTGALAVTGLGAQRAVELMNILPVLVMAALLALAVRRLFGQFTALLTFIFVLYSNLWPWMTVHRLIEPVLLMLVTVIFFAFFRYSQGNRSYLPVILITSAVTVGVKQSLYPVLASVLAVFLFSRKWKIFFLSSAAVMLLIAPFVLFSFKMTGAILPNPLGISLIDKQFKNAWWNQPKQAWETKLDQESNAAQLQKVTYEQFKEVQTSPSNLFSSSGPAGIINEFNAYPVASFSTEGFQSTTPEKLYLFFALLLILVPIALIQMGITRDKSLRLPAVFLGCLFLSATILWIKQPVFRYYLYLVIPSYVLYAIGLAFLVRRVKFLVKLAVLGFVVFLLCANLLSEVDRDLGYRYTAMHQRLPADNGGLSDSIRMGQVINNPQTPRAFVFTPMVEIAYYSRKRILWDRRLFFIDNKADLTAYLRHYDFDYVVLPFFSGQTTKKTWKYYEGVPSDSTFYEVLNDPAQFKLVASNATFTAYRRVKQ